MRHLPLAALGAALLLGSCGLEAPQLPTLESDWVLPLGGREITLRELLEDQPGIAERDGVLTLFEEGELEAVGVGESLEVELEGLSLSAAVGPLRIEPAAARQVPLALGELYPPAQAADGLEVVVPPFSFDEDTGAQDLPGFRRAEVDSGALALAIDNGLPVAVGGPGHELVLELWDPAGPLVARWDISTLVVPGERRTGSLDLAGQSLPDSVELRLSGGSPGSDGQPVAVDASAELRVELGAGALVVSSALAPISAASFGDQSTLALPDSVQLQEAVIAGGELGLSLSHDLPVPVELLLRVDALRDPGGQSLRVPLSVAPGATELAALDLAGWSLVPGAGNEVVVRMDASTPGSGGTAVEVDAAQALSLQLDPLVLALGAATGTVGERVVELEPTVVALELPDELEGVQLADAQLRLDIVHSLGLPADIELSLHARSPGGERDSTTLSLALAPAAGGEATVAFAFDGSNSELPRLLNLMPEELRIAGSVRVGGTGSIAAGDSLRARWTLSAPLRISLAPQELELDPERIGLDASLRDQLRERAVSLALEATLRSQLPVGGSLHLHVARSSAALFDAPDLVLGPIELPVLDAAARGGQAFAEARAELPVGAAELPLFTENPELFTAVRVVLPGTGGSFVELHADDTVAFTGRLRARLRLGGN